MNTPSPVTQNSSFKVPNKTWRGICGTGVPKVGTRAVQARLKFFNPTGSGTWLITEASAYTVDGRELALSECKVTAGRELISKDGQPIEDVQMFGRCEIHESELGYVSLKELSQVKLRFGLSIERDTYFKPITVVV